jgi:hypothetical protein
MFLTGSIVPTLIAASTAAAVVGQQQAANAQNKAARTSTYLGEMNNQLQQQQLAVSEQRQKRQAFRDMLKAQAVTETNANAQGGMASSALGGGLAQASNSYGQTMGNITENTQFQQSAANISAASSANRPKAGAGGVFQAISGGIGALANTKFAQNYRIS